MGTKTTFKEKSKRLITAALPYINNIPHLGNIVGSHLPADIFARFCRAKGYETLFIGGTDEHGSTSEIAAAEIGVDLEKFGKKLHDEHKKIYDWFEISYDIFSRTPTPNHYQTTQEFFKKIYENGFVTKGKMKVFYSPKDKRFLPDRYITGTCPKCGYENANGDQCEKCTTVLDPIQLINPKSILSGEKLELKETEHLFLRLDLLASKLEKWIKNQKKWRPQVTAIALSWIKMGLKERCITRDLKHGVPVPLKGFEDKVFYVWFDAPIGYVSFARETKAGKGDRFWKEKNAKVYHFLGKDNIPFHTIFWPAILLARGEFNLPYQVIGLQYLNYMGQKISKSKVKGVFCEPLPKLGLEPDIWRFYLTQIIPETNDSEFRWQDFQERVNSDLIGNYGNYVNRILNFIYSKLNGKITKPLKENLTCRDKEFLKLIISKTKKVERLLEKIEIRKARDEILKLSSEGNKYIQDTEPWVYLKKDPQRANDILYNGAVLLKTIIILFAPYLPQTAIKVWNYMNLPKSPFYEGVWAEVGKKLGKEHTIKKPEILFRKLTNEEVEKYKDVTSQETNLKGLFKA